MQAEMVGISVGLIVGKFMKSNVKILYQNIANNNKRHQIADFQVNAYAYHGHKTLKVRTKHEKSKQHRNTLTDWLSRRRQ